MEVGTIPNLKINIYRICDELTNNHQLITTKAVLAIINNGNNIEEDSVAKIINNWRLDKINASNSNILPKKSIKTKLIKAKREIKFLRAKIKALNSFYNRQRQELIMKIEGILYK